jgi:hypothetical protein
MRRHGRVRGFGPPPLRDDVPAGVDSDLESRVPKALVGVMVMAMRPRDPTRGSR